MLYSNSKCGKVEAEDWSSQLTQNIQGVNKTVYDDEKDVIVLRIWNKVGVLSWIDIKCLAFRNYFQWRENWDNFMQCLLLSVLRVLMCLLTWKQFQLRKPYFIKKDLIRCRKQEQLKLPNNLKKVQVHYEPRSILYLQHCGFWIILKFCFFHGSGKEGQSLGWNSTGVLIRPQWIHVE